MSGPETLPAARVGPYLRALAAGLDALAPDVDHVPLHEALELLRVLDPACSGDALQPCSLHPLSGLPSTGWVRRALAEQELALAEAPDEAQEEALRRAEAVDPALAARLRGRAALRVALRERPLLPLRRLQSRRRGWGRVVLSLDQVAADGRWSRLRLDVDTSGRSGLRGALSRSGERLPLEALESLLTRQSATPLEGLVPIVERALDAKVTRASRGRVGPFWFPGWRLPEGIPEGLSRGLLLHLSLELLSEELAGSRSSEDPMPQDDLPLPAGLGCFRERRFAATPGLEPALSAWCAQAGVRCGVVSLTPPR